LKNIVNDIEATGDHVSQSLATLESNALTIEKINEINPYFGIDKVITFKSNPYYLLSGNQNLFEYYKYINGEGKIDTFGVLISPFVSAGNNKSLFHVSKGDGNKNSITIGCKYIGATTIDGTLYLANESETVQVDCQSEQIKITKTGGYQAGKNIIIPYGTDLSNIGTGLTIEDIKTINPYIGIDEVYNKASPTFEKNEKIFQYYRDLGSTGLNGLGVMVQTYDDTHKGVLFEINNTSGINIITSSYKARLKANSNDVSFENDSLPNKNIVFLLLIMKSCFINQEIQ
jgi:hypothetical protein